jgi:hypothetical protein
MSQQGARHLAETTKWLAWCREEATPRTYYAAPPKPLVKTTVAESRQQPDRGVLLRVHRCTA